MSGALRSAKHRLRYRIARPRTKDRWWNILAALDRFVRTEGWWPNGAELTEYLGTILGRHTIGRELRELACDPVPLVEYKRKGWRLTLEGCRALDSEPVVARYAFRPRELPARRKRAARGVVRKAAHEVFEGRDGELPLVD